MQGVRLSESLLQEMEVELRMGTYPERVHLSEWIKSRPIAACGWLHLLEKAPASCITVGEAHNFQVVLLV